MSNLRKLWLPCHTRFTEWEVTALFYSALHYAGAFLASQGHNPQTQTRRNLSIGNLTNVVEDYQNPYAWSLDTRYRGVTFPPQRVGEIKAGPFRRVKEEMLAPLGDSS